MMTIKLISALVLVDICIYVDKNAFVWKRVEKI